MKLGTHRVMVVASHGADERSILPIPYPDSLIVGAGNDPWELVVEEDGAYVVEMAVESKQTSS